MPGPRSPVSASRSRVRGVLTTKTDKMVRKVRVSRRIQKKLNFSKGFTDSLNEETGTTGLKFQFEAEGKVKVEMDTKKATKYVEKDADASGDEESDGEEETRDNHVRG